MNNNEPDGPCHFCKQNVTHYESFCFGCGHYVCESCEKNHGLMGPHSVEEHGHESDAEDYDSDL